MTTTLPIQALLASFLIQCKFFKKIFPKNYLIFFFKISTDLWVNPVFVYIKQYFYFLYFLSAAEQGDWGENSDYKTLKEDFEFFPDQVCSYLLLLVIFIIFILNINQLTIKISYVLLKKHNTFMIKELTPTMVIQKKKFAS